VGRGKPAIVPASATKLKAFKPPRQIPDLGYDLFMAYQHQIVLHSHKYCTKIQAVIMRSTELAGLCAFFDLLR
jgi:hypothetical protein